MEKNAYWLYHSYGFSFIVLVASFNKMFKDVKCIRNMVCRSPGYVFSNRVPKRVGKEFLREKYSLKSFTSENFTQQLGGRRDFIALEKEKLVWKTFLQITSFVVICWENGGYYCLSSTVTILKNHLGANRSSRKTASDATRLTWQKKMRIWEQNVFFWWYPGKSWNHPSPP